MKKRVLCIVLVVITILSMSMSTFAAQTDVSITIDGKDVQFTESSGKPFVDENGRTQVPLRVVMEQYGCDVEWDGENNAAVITKGSTTVIVPIGKSYILVNGKTVAMDTAAVVQNGRTYLPIRAVLEAFGADVEWDNGQVSVTSPASGGFENIYIDKDGSLIFELANGSKINAGSVSNGKDGRDGADGVSVVNAYVDGSGNLMIALSSGRTINAGNVGVGGSMSGLTFADYAVGTKFYLTQPTGAFDVTVKVDDVPYTVKFSSVYYELTAKNSFSDTGAWIYGSGATTYIPYVVTMFIKGQTDAALAGKIISVSFTPSDDSVKWSYNAPIDSDGSFSISSTQGSANTAPWYAPKSLFLRSVSISGNSSTPSTPSTPSTSESEAIAAMLEKVAGTWSLPDDPEKTFTITADGTFTYAGTEYTAKYNAVDSGLLEVRVSGCADINYIWFYVDEINARVYDSYGSRYYYKNGTWDSVTLTKDNFFTYYEYKEEFTINYNAFGEYEDADIDYYYVLKDEYASRLIETASTATVKIQCDTYHSIEYVIDFENESYTITDLGRLSASNTYSYDSNYFSGGIHLIHNNSYLGGTEYTISSGWFCKIQFIDAIGTLYLFKNA